MTLFQSGAFTSHSGLPLAWKIECDALTPDDWAGLARIASELLPAFGAVEGVPRGGLAFADALRPYATQGPLLIADDVCTTGRSMVDARGARDAIGVVAFARGACPGWVTAVFGMPAAAGIRMTEETAAALARLRAWVRSEAEGADLPEHYPHTFRGQNDVERLVAAVEQAQSILRRAMEHGLNGSAYYHAMKAGDLGDEVKAYLENAGAR